MEDILSALVNGTDEYYRKTYKTVADKYLSEETPVDESQPLRRGIL